MYDLTKHQEFPTTGTYTVNGYTVGNSRGVITVYKDLKFSYISQFHFRINHTKQELLEIIDIDLLKYAPDDVYNYTKVDEDIGSKCSYDGFSLGTFTKRAIMNI